MIPRSFFNPTPKSGTNLLNHVVSALVGGRRNHAAHKDLIELIAGDLLIKMGCKRDFDQ